MASVVDLTDSELLICGQCNKSLPILEAANLYGIVFLFGKENGYFGTVCPDCRKTTLRSDDIKVIESLKDTLNESHDDGFRNGNLRYYSIPHSYAEHEKKSCYKLVYLSKYLLIQ